MADEVGRKLAEPTEPYQVIFDTEAQLDLQEYRATDQRMIVEETIRQLAHQPEVETRNRKLLRPNPVAKWELRLGTFRVFYNVDLDVVTVMVVAVGHKDHGTLHVRNQRVTL